MNDNIIEKISAFRKFNIYFPRSNELKEFDTFMKLICRRDVINATTQMLNSFETKYKCYKPSSREFLTMYMIAENEEDVFPTVSDHEKKIASNCKEILSTFENLCSNIISRNPNSIRDFFNKVKNFQKEMNEWKIMDKKRLLLEFAQAYFELTKTREFIMNEKVGDKNELTPDKVIWSEEIIKQKQKILEKVRTLAGNAGVEYVENYSPPLADEKTYKVVFDMAKKAYWNVFKEELRATPPNYEKLYHLLDEVRGKLLTLVSRNQQQVNEINEHIDPDFVKQQITNNVFNPTDFRNILVFITNKIYNLQTPINDTNLKEWKDNFMNRIKNGEKYATLLPDFFENVLDRIERIQLDVAVFHELMKKDNN